MTTKSTQKERRFRGLRDSWEALMAKRWLLPVLVGIGFVLSFAIPQFNLINPYYQLILIYVGINIILTTSLNLINGHMGEFSVGHAGFMSVGAYIAALLSTRVFPIELIAWLFPVSVLLGGLGAALIGLVGAIP